MSAGTANGTNSSSEAVRRDAIHAEDVGCHQDATKGLLGTDLEQVTLKGESYRDFWGRSAKVDSIRAISDQDDERSFEFSGRKDADDLSALLPHGGSVLEIGCGTGRVMRHVAAVCEQLHGIDISKGMVEQGRRRLAHLSNVSFEVGNGYDLAVGFRNRAACAEQR